MSKIRINKVFHFEMAHVLFQHDGACKNIHGHSYKLCVCVQGEPIEKSGHPKDGMVIDFGILKKIVQEHIIDIYDHSLVLNAAADEKWLNSLKNISTKLIIHDFQPTSEKLVAYFAEILQKHLPDKVDLFSLQLHETPTAYVEWNAADQIKTGDS